MAKKGVKKMANYATLTKMTNADFLEAVAGKAPQFQALVAKKTSDVFSDKGFEALKSIYSANGDPVSDFYSVALLVGLQYVDMVDFSNPLDDMNLVDRVRMSLGAYMQRTHVKRIKNVSPGWIGLKNGDSPDSEEVRKPEIIQDYWTLNWNYQNWITLQDFDLKGGWLRENGIGEVTSAIFEMIGLDRVEEEYSRFFRVLDGAINSVQYPLQASQKLELGADITSEAGVRAFIKYLKNIARSISAVPTTDMFNAAKYPNGNSAKNRMVILVREGILSEIEDVLGYAFNPEKLNIPFPIYEVPNFGGMDMVDAENNLLQPVYDKNGVVVGGIDANATVNGYATKRASDGKWIVNITSGGSTADTTIVEYDDLVFTDNETRNKNIVAVIMERGMIFELIQNEMSVEPRRSQRGQYTNPWFSQANNGIGYNHYKNLITVSKPSE